MTTNSTDRVNKARFNKICDKLEKSPECKGISIYRRPDLSIKAHFTNHIVSFSNIGVGEIQGRFLLSEMSGVHIGNFVEIVAFYKRLKIICENLNTIDFDSSHEKFLDISDFKETEEYLLYDSGNNPYEPARMHSSKLYELFRNKGVREAINNSFDIPDDYVEVDEKILIAISEIEAKIDYLELLKSRKDLTEYGKSSLYSYNECLELIKKAIQ